VKHILSRLASPMHAHWASAHRHSMYATGAEFIVYASSLSTSLSCHVRLHESVDAKQMTALISNALTRERSMQAKANDMS
jgi:hypothetical protein